MELHFNAIVRIASVASAKPRLYASAPPSPLGAAGADAEGDVVKGEPVPGDGRGRGARARERLFRYSSPKESFRALAPPLPTPFPAPVHLKSPTGRYRGRRAQNVTGDLFNPLALADT